MMLGFNKETHKIRYIIIPVHRRTEACNISGIVPIWFNTDKEIIARRGFRSIQHTITRTSRKSQSFDK